MGIVQRAASLQSQGLPVRCVIRRRIADEGVGNNVWPVGGAEFFQDVVHVGESEVGEFCLLAFAMSVKFFGDVADVLLLFGGAFGKREFVKAIGVIVVWSIFEKCACT